MSDKRDQVLALERELIWTHGLSWRAPRPVDCDARQTLEAWGADAVRIHEAGLRIAERRRVAQFYRLRAEQLDGAAA